jgi:hypothetical protein
VDDCWPSTTNDDRKIGSELFPHILAQVVTGEPLPLIYVIPVAIDKERGAFGTNLRAAKMHRFFGICVGPYCNGPNPYYLQGVYSRIFNLELSLHRLFTHSGKQTSFLSAICPAHSPRSSAEYPVAETRLSYGDGVRVTGKVNRRCMTSG